MQKGVSAAILVVADFIHTFPDEVRLMWPTPRSLPKTVFFILRYYAVVHSAFGLMYELPRGLTAEQCRPRFILLAVSSILVVTLSEVILYIRVYAFSEKNKKLLAFLVVIFVGFSSVAYYIFARFIFSVEFVTFPLPNIACIPMRADGLMLGLVFSATLGSILVVMLIMIYIAYQEYWEAKGSLLTIFYRDGISYFVCLSILASANIAVNFAAPGGYRFLFIQYVYVFDFSSLCQPYRIDQT
ncbi:hypothetical protein MD484_g516, partial [Candolleomyces efflorescens]